MCVVFFTWLQKIHSPSMFHVFYSLCVQWVCALVEWTFTGLDIVLSNKYILAVHLTLTIM